MEVRPNSRSTLLPLQVSFAAHTMWQPRQTKALGQLSIITCKHVHPSCANDSVHHLITAQGFALARLLCSDECRILSLFSLLVTAVFHLPILDNLWGSGRLSMPLVVQGTCSSPVPNGVLAVWSCIAVQAIVFTASSASQHLYTLPGFTREQAAALSVRLRGIAAAIAVVIFLWMSALVIGIFPNSAMPWAIPAMEASTVVLPVLIIVVVSFAVRLCRGHGSAACRACPALFCNCSTARSVLGFGSLVALGLVLTVPLGLFVIINLVPSCPEWAKPGLGRQTPLGRFPDGLSPMNAEHRFFATQGIRVTATLILCIAVAAVAMSVGAMADGQAVMAENRKHKADLAAETLRTAVAYISHEARGPLNAAMLSLALLNDDDAGSDGGTETASVIFDVDDGSEASEELPQEREARFMEGLATSISAARRHLDDLLVWQAASLDEQGVQLPSNPAWISPRQILRSVQRSFGGTCQSQGITLALHHSVWACAKSHSRPPPHAGLLVYADLDEILTVCGNGVSNAIKHTPSDAASGRRVDVLVRVDVEEPAAAKRAAHSPPELLSATADDDSASTRGGEAGADEALSGARRTCATALRGWLCRRHAAHGAGPPGQSRPRTASFQARSEAARRTRLESQPQMALGTLRLEVRDEGDGVSRDLLQSGKLFQPFARLRQGDDSLKMASSGLGLSIVRSLVCSRLAGEVGLSSEAGTGAVLFADIPVWTKPRTVEMLAGESAAYSIGSPVPLHLPGGRSTSEASHHAGGGELSLKLRPVSGASRTGSAGTSTQVAGSSDVGAPAAADGVVAVIAGSAGSRPLVSPGPVTAAEAVHGAGATAAGEAARQGSESGLAVDMTEYGPHGRASEVGRPGPIAGLPATLNLRGAADATAAGPPSGVWRADAGFLHAGYATKAAGKAAALPRSASGRVRMSSGSAATAPRTPLASPTSGQLPLELSGRPRSCSTSETRASPGRSRLRSTQARAAADRPARQLSGARSDAPAGRSRDLREARRHTRVRARASARTALPSGVEDDKASATGSGSSLSGRSGTVAPPALCDDSAGDEGSQSQALQQGGTPKSVSSAQSLRKSQRRALRGRLCFVVDDERVNRTLLSALLRRYGVRVREFDDGADVIAAFKRLQARAGSRRKASQSARPGAGSAAASPAKSRMDDAGSSEVVLPCAEIGTAGDVLGDASSGEAPATGRGVAWPCLMTLDLQMPRKDGFAVLEFLKSAQEAGETGLRDLQTLVVSGNAGVRDRHRLRQFETLGMLAKPIDTDELIAVLCKAVERCPK